MTRLLDALTDNRKFPGNRGKGCSTKRPLKPIVGCLARPLKRKPLNGFDVPRNLIRLLDKLVGLPVADAGGCKAKQHGTKAGMLLK